MIKINKGSMLRFAAIVSGVAINVVLCYLTYKFKFPLYFDTIGTIGVSIVAGIFPGLITAMLTNICCGFFNPQSVYYSILSVLIAGVTAYFANHNYFNKKRRVLLYVLITSFIGGILGSFLQLALLGQPQFEEVNTASGLMSAHTHINFYICFLLINFALNSIDKGLATAIVLAMLRFIPAQSKLDIWNSGWKQRPLTKAEIKNFTYSGKKGSLLQAKITRLLVIATLSMTLIMGLISVRLYFNTTKEDYAKNAMGAAKLTAGILRVNRIDEYLNKGHDAPGYDEIEEELYNIRDNCPGVVYLYVVRFQEDGSHYIFDIDTEDVKAYAPGEIVPYEEDYYPHIDALLAGEDIEPIESDEMAGYVLTTLYPVRNSSGETLCYVGADVLLSYLSDYAIEYFWKSALIFSGFFLLILAYGFWTSKFALVHPINSMASIANSFVYDTDNQAVLAENVKKIHSLDIKTGDEIENLYLAMCKMTEDTAAQMTDLKYQSKMINQMQTGLIITMADLVESRDENTGYHIQKTADYVAIILDALVKKGYYADKLTPKYIVDVEMSAPLHDIGKINIPDAVLNKPGKLTDEEYEIMKTHTTAGKKIIEKAINTVQGENYLKEARNMAGYHHEKWDGSGYPEGLKGSVIPLSARIMAVADVFDALTARRVYKDPMPYEKAISIIVEGSGTHFDPKCVEAFVDSEVEVRRVLKKYQDL